MTTQSEQSDSPQIEANIRKRNAKIRLPSPRQRRDKSMVMDNTERIIHRMKNGTTTMKKEGKQEPKGSTMSDHLS
ncbi:hypothetical protein [uncultured Cohaesibacter sp.]|uniref:hypothetical protein n=1 Tax=uncultured Cohaesibacter sp. TaxID=1002546 RepID=UPI0029C63A55|nr:hypothetical protein [uncultured Cohaesibacter sp.]